MNIKQFIIFIVLTTASVLALGMEQIQQITEIDMADKKNASMPGVFFTDTKNCHGKLIIHYNFGQSTIWKTERQNQCIFNVSLTGEMNEKEEPQSFICAADFYKDIDWLKKNGQRRTAPPLEEIRMHKQCKHKEKNDK
ncbi:hypothetical protein SAMN02745866_04248 [Alteromonadaceae bacterium Bs31]|nr:hypothetical protein SAMN02745866_04248 [Alteromonadaceae bacterium Bs31]